MRYFLDTEFYEKGAHLPIQLISIALVAEDGREFYVENADVDLTHLSPWLKENVYPHLIRSKGFDYPAGSVLPHDKIGTAVCQFLNMDVKPIFYGYFADYDWVVFCQLFGAMVDLPEHFPFWCRDLKQEMSRLGLEKPTLKVGGPAHNAMADARWNKACHEWLVSKGSTL